MCAPTVGGHDWRATVAQPTNGSDKASFTSCACFAVRPNVELLDMGFVGP